MNGKDVALVLSSGGPRGWAYIGAIEELESRGYRIRSVAGTSIGSLIGGIYAAGKLHELKEWLFSLDAWKVFSLMDISLSMNHLVKGDKVINALKEIVPDVNIEDLQIPYRAVAADLYTGEEVVFDRGPLFDAIRASISIPSLFRPVKYGFRTLVDGGIVNTMPISRVIRSEGDILVAFDVNDIDVDSIRQSLIDDAREEEERQAEEKALNQETREVVNAIRNDSNLTFFEKIKLAGAHGQKIISHKWNEEDPEPELAYEESYYSILSRTFSIMNHVLAKEAAERYRPDVLVKMPFDAYGEISDYANAREISEAGRRLMKEALDSTYIFQEHFHPQSGMFNKTALHGPRIKIKRAPVIDYNTLSSNSIMADNLLLLHKITKDKKCLEIFEQQIYNIQPQLIGSGPFMAGWGMQVLNYLTSTLPLNTEQE